MSSNRPFLFVIAYLLWFVSTALSALIFFLAREAFLVSLVVAGSAGELSNSQQFYQSLRVAAASHWSMLLFGILIIAVLVAFEHYYRTGAAIGLLRRRFYLVTWVQGAVLLLTHIIYALLRAAFMPFSLWSILLIAVEAVITGVFWLLWKKSPSASDVLRI